MNFSSVKPGALIENRGEIVLVLQITDNIKYGLPGFDGVQAERDGYWRGRWGYTEDTTAIVAAAGSYGAKEYAQRAAAGLLEQGGISAEWVDTIATVYPDAAAAARAEKGL